MSNLSTFRLSTSIFNATLFKNMCSTWFADLPATARMPSDENELRWFGLNATRDQRLAFDESLRSAFGAALDSISPDRLRLPPFRSYAADRADSALLSAPFRRLDVLRAAEPQRAEAGLGLLLLLDQVPRNIFRANQHAVFTHYDRLALALVHCMMQPATAASGAAAAPDGDGAELADLRALYLQPALTGSPPRFVFVTLPLMHSEDLADHDMWTATMGSYRAGWEAAGDVDATKYLKYQAAFEERHRVVLERFGRYPHRNECLGRETTDEEKKYMQEGGETFGPLTAADYQG